MIKDWTHVSRIRCIPKMESLGPQVAHPGFVPTVGRNCYDVTSTSVIVSNHVCMPMTMGWPGKATPNGLEPVGTGACGL
jgi:hypothetical protein